MERQGFFPFVDFEELGITRDFFHGKNCIKMHFVICIYRDDDLRYRLQEFIQYFGGEAVFNVNKKTMYSALMVQKTTYDWPSAFTGDVFTINYFKDCVEQKAMLDISKYRHNKHSLLVDDFNYMQIIFNRTWSWADIPESFYKKKEAMVPKTEDEDEELDTPAASSTNNIADIPFGAASTSRQINKHSRASYSQQEREAVVKYIVRHCAYQDVNGRKLWQKMEEAKVCKIRTWQSMKEHFRKKILPNIESFKFLNKNDIDMFKSVD